MSAMDPALSKLRELSAAFTAMQSAGLVSASEKDFDGMRTVIDLEREIIVEQQRVLAEAEQLGADDGGGEA